MIRTIGLILIYVLGPVLIIEAYKRFSSVRKVGTVLIAYAIGIVLALSGLTSFEAGSAESALFTKIQTLLMNIAVPLAIPLMLFNCDFRLWTKALPKTICSLACGIFAMLVAVISGYYIFQGRGIPELNKVAAMMTGIYTGGTMNFNALGASLEIQPSTMAIVLAFEMVLTTPYIFFIIGGGYRLFRRLLPASLPMDEPPASESERSTEEKVSDIENYSGMFRRENVGSMFAGLGLSVLMLALGAGLALLTTGKLNELVVILTITTLAIAASFFRPVRQMKKTFELGMYFILVFSIIVASLFDIHSVNSGSMLIGGFVLWIMLVGGLIHLALCRLTGVNGDLFTVSQVALLCSPPFVPPVVGAMGNKKVLISGIVVGLAGYAVGTYLGLLIAWIL